MSADLDELERLIAQTVSGTVWVHEGGEIHRAYTVDGEPTSDAIASGLATGKTDTPDAEAICAVMNAASALIAAARPSLEPPSSDVAGWPTRDQVARIVERSVILAVNKQSGVKGTAERSKIVGEEIDSATDAILALFPAPTQGDA